MYLNLFPVTQSSNSLISWVSPKLIIDQVAVNLWKWQLIIILPFLIFLSTLSNSVRQWVTTFCFMWKTFSNSRCLERMWVHFLCLQQNWWSWINTLWRIKVHFHLFYSHPRALHKLLLVKREHFTLALPKQWALCVKH